MEITWLPINSVKHNMFCFLSFLCFSYVSGLSSRGMQVPQTGPTYECAERNAATMLSANTTVRTNRPMNLFDLFHALQVSAKNVLPISKGLNNLINCTIILLILWIILLTTSIFSFVHYSSTTTSTALQCVLPLSKGLINSHDHSQVVALIDVNWITKLIFSH